MKIPIIADVTKKLATEYGVLIEGKSSIDLVHYFRQISLLLTLL